MRIGHLILCIVLAVVLCVAYKVSKGNKLSFSVFCWGISLVFLLILIFFSAYYNRVAALYEQGTGLSAPWWEALAAGMLTMEDAPGSGRPLETGFLWGAIYAGGTFVLGFIPIVRQAVRRKK